MKVNYDIIDELLPDELLGDNLFHYTSADGLKGMIQEGKIWCTHIFYLNDIEENLNGWKTFFKVFDSFEKDHEHFESFKKKIETDYGHWRQIDVENITSDLFKDIKISDYRHFVFSLSLVDDDLNQWRSYTPESFGFSIQFNFNKEFRTLQSVLKDLNPEDEEQPNNCKIFIRKCVYDSESKDRIINRLLDFYFAKFEKLEHNWSLELYFNILTICLFFKNEKFKAEEECRIVVLPLYDNIEQNGEKIDIIKIRNGKNFLVPYIELDMITSCLKGVTIGPTPFKYHSKESLKLMIKGAHLPTGEIDIRQTKVPYRSW